MGLLRRGPVYPQHAGMGMMPRRRGLGIKNVFLVLGILFGLYYLNLSFQWVSIPESISSFQNILNAITGILLVVLGVMAAMKPRIY